MFALVLLAFLPFFSGNAQFVQFHRGGVIPQNPGGFVLRYVEKVKIPVVRKEPEPEPESSVQEMFTDIFNWNKDIGNDPRFKGKCPPPDISEINKIAPKSAVFTGLNPQHRMAVMMIRRIIMGGKDLKNTVCLAGALRDLPGLNPNVWIRGVFGAHLSSSELFQLQAPPLVEVMPHLFLTGEALQSASQSGNQDQGTRRCTLVDGAVGRDNGFENLLWYFREDVQVNAFHLNWHLIYPIAPETKADRQGELFYFTHKSHLARYHAERLSNGLPPITPLFLDYNVPIEEQYNPHLRDTNSGSNWTPRRGGLFPQDTAFENSLGFPPIITVANQTVLVNRLLDSIRFGWLVLPNNRVLILDSRTGVDYLGDTVEASSFTVNGDYYSAFGFHNEGHVILGSIEDPRNATNLPPGVMAEVATAMRDPVFYRYHTAVEEVFDQHKQLIQPYQPDVGELPLNWLGIVIDGLEVIEDANQQVNLLTTFFARTSYELSRGLDFQRSGIQGNLAACNRDPQQQSSLATVRIFLAPRYNELGKRYNMVEQRSRFFMMDLFSVNLQPGPNIITRPSTESSLTIPIPGSQSGGNYCGCGWPHNMLLPRGLEGQGMAFDLFVMLTDGASDVVPSLRSQATNATNGCAPAPIYCGRMNDSYPDSRPMGYPFDRLPYSLQEPEKEAGPRFVKNLDEYMKYAGNMAAAKIKIVHLGERVDTESNLNRRQEQNESERLQNLQRVAATPPANVIMEVPNRIQDFSRQIQRLANTPAGTMLLPREGTSSWTQFFVRPSHSYSVSS